MKKFIVLFIVLFALTSCGTLTPEEIKHNQWKQEQETIKQDKDRAYNLEQLKLQAEIEKAKPIEVKVQELKNEETTVGEGIQNAVGIWAATMMWLGIINMMTK